MNLYVELAYGSPSGRGIVAPLSGVQSYIAMARETGDELYRSLFLFEEDLREHFKVFKTIRSYRGNCHMKNLVLDLDAGKDDFETIVRMRQLLDKLETFGLTMDLWFSGTGFHLTCPDPFHIDPSPELPQILRQTLEAMELPHIDLKIYERSRIIRVANTVNKKSGLFKINFPQDLLVSPDAMVLIKALATHPKDIVLNKAAVPDLHHLVKSPIPATLSIDVKAEDPSRFVTCMQKLYARGPVKGRRHSDLIALVSSWRRAGLPSQAAATLAEKWIGMGADPMSSYEVTRAVADIYTKGYKLSCEHPVMKEFCDSRCFFFRAKNYGSSIIEAAEAEKTLVEWARTDFAGRSIDLQATMGLHTPYKIYPGELVLLYGDTGMGKSALAQNLLINSGLKSTYITLEMPSFFLYRRFIQIHKRMSKEEVLEYYRKETNSLSEELKHITMTHVPPTLDDIRRIIAEQKPQLVVIDPIDALHVPGHQLEKENLIGNTLKEIANSQEVILLCVHHIAKHMVYDAFGNRKRLTNLSGKGSSTIPHRADKVIGIEPPVKPIETLLGEAREVSSLKNRDEAPFNQIYSFISNTFRFVPIEDELEEAVYAKRTTHPAGGA